MISIKNEEEIEKMRKAGKLAARTLDFISPCIKEGVSTEKIDQLCYDFIIKNDAYPAPLNYHGFPKSVCTSLNNVVCHGIPSKEDVLKDGDILNVDVTVKLNGYHGDTSRTFLIGEPSSEAKDLVKRTKEAMYRGIEVVRPGAFLYEVGRAIEKYVFSFGYGIVKDYGGHGIGQGFHEEPSVFHFYTLDNKIELKSGMTFTIEPMINAGGSHKVITSPQDGWTVYTQDGSLSAQFEHTVLVTDSGREILTKSLKYE